MNRFHFPPKNYTGILLSPPPLAGDLPLIIVTPPSSQLSFCLHFNDIAWWIIWNSRKFRARYYFFFFVGQISLNYKKIVGLSVFWVKILCCKYVIPIQHSIFLLINHSFTIVEENFKVLFSEKHQYGSILLTLYQSFFHYDPLKCLRIIFKHPQICTKYF